MLFAAGTYAVGVSLQLAASQVVVFVLGRVLLGMGLGLISVIVGGPKHHEWWEVAYG